MTELTKEQLDKHIDNNEPFVIDFYADWCEKCVDMMPTIEKLADIYNGKVPFYKVDIDKSPEFKEWARIKAVPMLTIYNKGHMRGFIFGESTEENIMKKINFISKVTH